MSRVNEDYLVCAGSTRLNRPGCGKTRYVGPPRALPEGEALIAGLDLGKLKDFTAFAGVRRVVAPGASEATYYVQQLHRFPRGTLYLDISAEVGKWMKASPWKDAELIVDMTGVGVSVVEMLEKQRIPKGINPVMITGGFAVTRRPGGGWNVARNELCSAVQAVLSGRRLHIATGLDLARDLNKELKAFVDRPPSTAGADAIEWRDSTKQHDDLVFAVALAVWFGEHALATDFNLRHLRLDKPAAPPSPVAPYPGWMRWFNQSQKWQPLPRPHGEEVIGCPDFRTPQEAAHFVVAIHQMLEADPPDFEPPELDEETCRSVETKAAELVRDRRLKPPQRS
jgi:hypothetical protein